MTKTNTKQTTLWGEEFDTLLNPTSQEENKSITLDSEQDIEKALKSNKLSLKDKVSLVRPKVFAILGKQESNVQVIYDKQELLDYINKGIEIGSICIDTETNNSLKTYNCKLMGLCLYVKDQKQVYVPVNHISIDTNERLANQLTEKDIAECLTYLLENKGNTQFIFHHAKFDIEVIKTTCGIELPVDWDTMIAGQMLNENESSSLKEQYISKIDPTQAKYSIEHLFVHTPYEYFDPETFALYAATDAMMTYRLYEWQLKQFKNEDLKDVYEVYKEVELPIIPVIVDMELRGVQFDTTYNEKLKEKYHGMLDDIDRQIQDELVKIQPLIDKWRLSEGANKPLPTTSKTKSIGKTKNEQLGNPILLSSPTQLAILFYDVLKEPTIDSSTPRGTGEEILKKMNNNIAKLMTKRREVYKLITSFIDTLPEEVGEDGKIHCNFNQIGAKTGRFSCDSPNLQQIPSHNKELRMQFKASETYEVIEKENNTFIIPNKNWVYVNDRWVNAKDLTVGTTIQENKGSKNTFTITSIEEQDSKIKILVSNSGSKTLYTKVRYILVSSDFSQQEPRMLSQFSDDENMIGAYVQGKDIYATIASDIYNNRYEDNLEFYQDETPNPEGKRRRASVKSLLLGIMYGRGAYSIAEEFGTSIYEAQEIIDSFYRAYPKVKKWVDTTQADAKKTGYVCDLWGRRRRLDDIKLPKYEIKEDSENSKVNFNPFLECENRKVANPLIEEYSQKLQQVRNKREFEKFREEAKKHGIELKNNSSFISQAERQCVNARIQGSSATMTKKAMIKIFNDQRLKDLDFHLLIAVHDELIGECPYENAEKVSKILTEDMRTCLNDDKKINFRVPFKCDPDVSFNWYWNDYINSIKEEYKELKESGNKNPFETLKNTHTEVNEVILKEALNSESIA